MNLRQPNSNDATRTFNRSKNVVPMSGLCSRCMDDCTGNCEIFKAAFRGRELIYPGPFGEITAGADKDYPVDYSHLNIQGYALGGTGLPEGVKANSDNARRKVDDGIEARIIALACEPAPQGYARWTLRLLEEKMKVTMEEAVGKDAIRRTLKKVNLDLKVVVKNSAYTEESNRSVVNKRAVQI